MAEVLVFFFRKLVFFFIIRKRETITSKIIAITIAGIKISTILDEL